MMHPQDAIKELKIIDAKSEAVNTAILALEKATSKVVQKGMTDWGTYVFTCPNCHVEFTGNWRYCPNCGQKLRWEE